MGVCQMDQVVSRASLVRDNPPDVAARLSRAIGLCVVHTSPLDRRGLLFGRIVAAGLASLRPGLQDMSGAALDQAARQALACIREALEDGGLAFGRGRPALAARDLDRMRTLVKFGMTWTQVAGMEGVPEDELRAMCGAQRRSRRKPARIGREANPGGTQTIP
jgi:type II secretory pathway pseudopilin PulG